MLFSLKNQNLSEFPPILYLRKKPPCIKLGHEVNETEAKLFLHDTIKLTSKY